MTDSTSLVARLREQANNAEFGSGEGMTAMQSEHLVKLLREAATALEAKHTQLRCEGRYPVPQTAPPRDEPFDVTCRCAFPKGHDGPHGGGVSSPPDGSIE